MTDDSPVTVPTEARDKHLKTISRGDVVEVVHFGEHHTLVVEDITEALGHHYLHGSVTIRVPSTAASRRDSRNPKSTPRDGARVVHTTTRTKE